MQRKFRNLRCIFGICPRNENKRDLQKTVIEESALRKILQKMKEFRNLACKNAGDAVRWLASFSEKTFPYRVIVIQYNSVCENADKKG